MRAVYRAFAAGLERQPRVAPAMLADAFANPNGPAGRLVTQYFPRALAALGSWLDAEITAGRLRPLPTLLLIQQMLGPLLMHLLSAPLLDRHHTPDTADLDQVCIELADAFVRGVGTTTTTEPTTGRKQ